jgi:hypothetical protein
MEKGIPQTITPAPRLRLRSAWALVQATGRYQTGTTRCGANSAHGFAPALRAAGLLFDIGFTSTRKRVVQGAPPRRKGLLWCLYQVSRRGSVIIGASQLVSFTRSSSCAACALGTSCSRPKLHEGCSASHSTGRGLPGCAVARRRGRCGAGSMIGLAVSSSGLRSTCCTPPHRRDQAGVDKRHLRRSEGTGLSQIAITGRRR